MRGIDHVGVLTDDLDAVRSFADSAGLKLGALESVPGLGVEVQWIDAAGLRIEVISPRGEGRAARALAQNGPGADHIAFTVEDLDSELQRWSEQGFALADRVPREGIGGTRIAFLESAGVGGLRVELVERRSDAAAQDLPDAQQ